MPLWKVHWKYKAHSMITRDSYCANIELVMTHAARLPMKDLAIVECGTWRGGMTFGMLDVVPECRHAHMFDSFEGLPVPTDRDGRQVKELFDEELFHAKRNIAGYEDVRASATDFGHSDRITFHKGWFDATVSPEAVGREIGILRVDGDWYDSTLVVLERLFDRVVPGGLIIVDDYYHWPGCSQAVHDFLSGRQAPEAIRVWRESIPYIVKLSPNHLSTPVSDEERARRIKRNKASGHKAGDTGPGST